MKNIDQIKRTLNSGSGMALKKHLLSKLNELRDIANIKEYPNEKQQANEIQAQRRAYLKLKEIYEEIMDVSKELPVNDPRDDYSVR